MKKVIVFRVEDVLVKDFNREESLKRVVVIGENRIRRGVGLEEIEREYRRKCRCKEDGCEELEKSIRELKGKIEGELRRNEVECRKKVERREKEFYDVEFERSKFKVGVKEVLRVLKGMEGMGVEVYFMSDYRKSKVGRLLWNNGMREVEVMSGSGDWVGRVLDGSGKERRDVVLFSNKGSDKEREEELNIKVERYDVEGEGIKGLFGKIGLKQCA